MPFTVIRKMGPDTYEVDMPGRRKSKQVFHVNLLKEWRERNTQGSPHLLVQAIAEEEDNSEQFFPTSQLPSAPDLSHLTPQQQGELVAIIPHRSFCREA